MTSLISCRHKNALGLCANKSLFASFDLDWTGRKNSWIGLIYSFVCVCVRVSMYIDSKYVSGTVPVQNAQDTVSCAGS